VQPRSERNRGLVFTTAGVAILVAALLFGLTKTSNGETVADWVSIITAIGGLIVGGVGLYMTSHERGRGMGPAGRTPHAPS
jgi:membrane protease YdiL (CAAX protease family)